MKHYTLGSNLCDQYAAQEAQQRRERLISYGLVCCGLILASLAVAFLGGEELFNLLGRGEL